MDSRLWLGANLQCLRWKRGALDGNYRKVLCKLMAFGLRKRAVFSAFRKVFYK